MKTLRSLICLGIGIFLIEPTAVALTLCQEFEVHQAIPDAGEYLDLRSFSLEPREIIEVEVSLNISGGSEPGFNGDLYVTLSNESGGFAVLLNRPGKNTATGVGYSDSGLNISMSDSAPNGDIHKYRVMFSGDNVSLGVPLTGEWQPDGRATDPNDVVSSDVRTRMLKSFAGTSADGNWRLFVADMSSGGLHTLNSWALTITVVPEPPPYALLMTGLVLLGVAAWRRQ
jgi:subtilisin-like proprotein convertase family protein